MDKNTFLHDVGLIADDEWCQETIRSVRIKESECSKYDPTFAKIYGKFAEVWTELNAYAKSKLELEK